ncbi:MAG: YitT family protein [Syntrophomonadaceae bacterium]|nr:YitT family protein [Syntrophomonadaceae bacterium]
MRNRGKVWESVNSITEQMEIKDIVGILLGCAILALGVQGVLIPHHMLHGGIAGIAIIINYLTKIDIWLWYLLLNIPIFIAGYKMVSRRFFIYSLVGTGGLSASLALFKTIQFGTGDLFLDAVMGGVIAGIGSGIIFSSKGSSGGLDVIAIIVQRYRGHNIGQVYFFINVLVLLAALLVSNLTLTLFSALSIYVSAQVVDYVQAGWQVKRTAMIISDKWEEVADSILFGLHRGCTYISARGVYSGKDKQIVVTTVAKTEVPRLKEIVFQIDSGAFIIINEAVEVYGKGFKSNQHEF